uniref:Uncharacterized protein n=1 Tax=Candidatus Kentrum sp. DK TaxID=2126562 RepID=A0A450RVG4_9GAMM|nr:MAG: hypothetical protein BECKDK2373C_GA0170839_100322 [Candidatus Kentron sp. DK]
MRYYSVALVKNRAVAWVTAAARALWSLRRGNGLMVKAKTGDAKIPGGRRSRKNSSRRQRDNQFGTAGSLASCRIRVWSRLATALSLRSCLEIRNLLRRCPNCALLRCDRGENCVM